jgi:hypothetical protein
VKDSKNQNNPLSKSYTDFYKTKLGDSISRRKKILPSKESLDLTADRKL